MIIVNDEMVEEFSTVFKINRGAKLALCKVVSTARDPNKITKEELFRKALLYVNKNDQDPITKSDKKKCGRTSKVNLNKRKMILGGSKNSDNNDFWMRSDAFEIALNDDMYPDTQPGGNYEKAKRFLKNDWVHVEMFTMPELIKSLTEKYPEKDNGSGFRVQRWHNAHYWEDGSIAIKPLWKKASYRDYHNIFYQEPTL